MECSWDYGHEFAVCLRYNSNMSTNNVAVHRNAEIFCALHKEWNPLVQRSHANRIFSTWEWNWHWWNVYAPGELAIVTVRDEAGQLLGLAPWFIETEDDQRLLATIGCDEVSDYLDIIIARGAEERVLSALTDYLRNVGIDADCFYFCNMPADSPARLLWPALLGAAGFSTKIEQQEVCPRIDLPSHWEDYLAQLNKKQRHELRRKIRRLEAATDAVSVHSVTEEATVDLELPRFFDLMADSDPAKAAFVADPANREFFRVISRAAAQNGWLQLNFLTIDGEDCAAYFNFRYGDELLVYNSGLRAGRYSTHSPGIVLLAYLIQDAIAAGIRTIDFLRGDETYKFRMGGVGAPIYKLLAEMPISEPCSPAMS